MRYKVSVIMPVYNAEKYLNRSINSILAQTISYCIEIVIIDDGSVDNSLNIINTLMKKTNNIKLYHQKHKGAGIARNNGIKFAEGEFISFLDADDFYWNINALEKMYQACIKNCVDICGSFRKNIEKGVITESSLFSDIDIPITGAKVAFQTFQNDFDYQSFIFNRKFILDNEIKFPYYIRYQDPPFFLKAMNIAKEFWVEPVYLYCYKVDSQTDETLCNKVEYILRGIKDTLEIAIEGNYIDLFKKIISRINNEYRKIIFMGYSKKWKNYLMIYIF